MPLKATSTARALSSIPLDKREELENLLAESLPVLFQIEVFARAGKKKGKTKPTGLRFTYDREDDDTPTELADAVCDQVEDYADEHGPHCFSVRVWIAGDDRKAKMVDTVDFILDGGSPEPASPRDESLELLKVARKTNKELNEINVRQAKHLESVASSVSKLLEPSTKVRIAELEHEQWKEERRLQHEADLENEKTVRETLAPLGRDLGQHLGPAIADWIRSKKDPANGPPPTAGKASSDKPRSAQLAELIEALPESTASKIADTLGDEIWAVVLKATECEAEEDFDLIKDAIAKQLTMQQLMAVHGLLPDDVAKRLLALIS